MRRLSAIHCIMETEAYGNGGVNMVLSSDSVRGEQVNDLSGTEASVAHTSQNLVDRVLRLGDESIGCRNSRVGATRKEVEARCTLTVC